MNFVWTPVKSRIGRGSAVFLCIFMGLLLLSLLSTVRAQVPLYSLRTKNLRLIYYDENHSYIIPHLARCFENSLSFHRKLFDYTPSEEVTILLQDFNDYGSGGTNTIPWNYINIGIEPFDYVYEISPANERMNWVMNHELVHVLATDKAATSDKFFRILFFGKVIPIAENPLSMVYSFLTTPRWYSPRWYHEGIAVFMETWMSGGIGRAQNGYDEMVFRSMVNDSSHFYDIVGLESEGTTIDFQIGVNSYLYGTRFVCYLAYKYGIEKLLQWYNRTKESKRYFTAQFRNVYGMSLDDTWQNWISWEHEWQEKNLETIRQNPVTPHRKICQQEPLGSVSRTYYDPKRNKIYVGINYPGQISQIASIDLSSGNIEKICDMPSPALYYVTSLAYDPEGNKLFFTTHNSSQWRNLNAVNLKNGEQRVLLKRARMGDITFNSADKSIWGVRHHDGFSSLVRVLPPYDSYQEILRFTYGKDLFDIDISPDGSMLTGSLVEINGDQRLIKFDIKQLLQGETTYDILEEFEDNSPQNFVFSSDGRSLYGTSYYSGVSNVYRYDFINKTTNIVSNTENGFFRPLVMPGDSLLVYRYSGKGFTPVMIPDTLCTVEAITFLGNSIAEEYPVVKSWKLVPPNPKLIDLDTLTIAAGSYKSLQNLRFASVYPVVEGYKDMPAYGFRFNLLDPLGGIDALNFTVSYTPNKVLPAEERFHFFFDYVHWNLNLYGTYNGTDFYDLFGPTKASRKGYSLGMRYSDYLIYDKPKKLEYTLNAAGYGGLDKLPNYQNINVSFDKFLTFSADLDYSYLLRSLGAVEYEQGVTWKLASRMNYVNAKLYPRFYTNYDFGFLLPWHHSSLWFRSSLGYSLGDRNEPFANFYFGGFGNNWVDYQEIQRYHSYYSFPGFELNELGGTNYGKVMLEWTFPPIRFVHFGFPSFYFRWARFALFSAAMVTNFDSKEIYKTYLNVGGQFDVRLVTFSLLKSTFSLGYAQAFREDQRVSREFMISLKIL